MVGRYWFSWIIYVGEEYNMIDKTIKLAGEYPSDWRPVQYSREPSQAIQELHKPHAAAMRMTLGRL